MEPKPTARLENWSLVATAYSPYTAPEAMASRLQGNVYEHYDLNNVLPDGLFVTTSRVISADFKARVAETKNTAYTLGAPDPKWIEYLKANGSDLQKYGLDVYDDVRVVVAPNEETHD